MSTLTTPRTWARATRRERLETIGYHTLMIVMVFAYIFPALWALSMSTSAESEPPGVG